MITALIIGAAWLTCLTAIVAWTYRVGQQRPSLDAELMRRTDEEFAQWKADDELTDDELFADVVRGYAEMEKTVASFYRELTEVRRLEDLFAMPSAEDQR
jgi:hypothetical protein